LRKKIFDIYTQFRLIAVNYEARKFNIKRGMRGDQAKELCPEFHAFFVNNKRGKADLYLIKLNELTYQLLKNEAY
jgi:nucleotidyltransferase/DNA polymerase involved in DNA repair